MSEKEDFVKIANTNDIQPSEMKEVQLDEESLCIVNVEGKYYAIGNICTHAGWSSSWWYSWTLWSWMSVTCFQIWCMERWGEEPPAGEPELVYQIKGERNNILSKKK